MNETIDRVRANQAELDLLAETYNESTGLSWLWAFLFGPIYFWVHGFVGRGFLIFALNLVIIGFIVAPFIVYPAWKKRAYERAEKMQAVSRVAQGR